MKNFLKKVKDKLTVKKVVLIVIAVALIAAIIVSFFSCGGKEEQKSSIAEAKVKYGDIVETIEQSGTIEPYERREITALVNGEVISSPFKEGDFVNEGDTLYQIDDEDAQLNLEKTRNGITKSQLDLNETNKNIAKLNIYASSSGTLSNFKLEKGDEIQAGEIGKIVNTSNLTAKIPFTEADYNKISVGNSVTVTSAAYMMSMQGTVTHKYDSGAGTAADGSYLKNIEVSIQNPGSLSAGVTVSGAVNTYSGTVYSAKSGQIESGSETSLRAEVSGTVKTVNVKNGDNVTSGQLIATLESDNLSNSRTNSELSLSDSKISLKSGQKALEDYNITAPISGTVITKNVEVGDKIDSSNAKEALMVVADMSKMKFTISVDELEIEDISLGQTAVVDADALPGVTFSGVVTSIASEGTVSGQGVTTYDVEIVIDEPEKLMPGMNVNANIVVSQIKDVLNIPEEALNKAADGKATVYVKTKNTPKDAKFPEGYEEKEIEYGASNGTLVEIKSGLSEGETVVYMQYTAPTDDFMTMMQDAHNQAADNMANGGAPGGGMGGGPGGNGGGGPNGGPGGGM